MSYFPEDIPFMSKEELKENRIRIPKDATDTNVSDTISRQAAINAVRNSYDEILDFTSTGRTIADSVEDILSELPPAQPEPQWIPVGERLPEEAGYYITSNEYDGVGEDFYYDGHFWNADKNIYEVIAWMPKPKAYKLSNK